MCAPIANECAEGVAPLALGLPRIERNITLAMSWLSHGTGRMLQGWSTFALRVRQRLTASGNLIRPAVSASVEDADEWRSKDRKHVVDEAWARYRHQLKQNMGWSLGWSDKKVHSLAC